MLLNLRQLGAINQFDFEQSAFKASRRLPLTLAAGTNIGVTPEVADPKADQRPLFRIIDTDVTLHQCLGISARDFDVKKAQRRSEEHTSELQSLMHNS